MNIGKTLSMKSRLYVNALFAGVMMALTMGGLNAVSVTISDDGVVPTAGIINPSGIHFFNEDGSQGNGTITIQGGAVSIFGEDSGVQIDPGVFIYGWQKVTISTPVISLIEPSFYYQPLNWQIFSIGTTFIQGSLPSWNNKMMSPGATIFLSVVTLNDESQIRIVPLDEGGNSVPDCASTGALLAASLLGLSLVRFLRQSVKLLN